MEIVPFGVSCWTSVKVEETFVPVPLPAGVAPYSHCVNGGGDGGAEGGWQCPSQSTMYSTCTKLPSYGFSSTAGVAVVTKVYVPSRLRGSSTILTHSKKSPTITAPFIGLHGPCTSSPLDVVLTTYSSSSL